MQVRFYSFQFLCSELAEEVQEVRCLRFPPSRLVQADLFLFGWLCCCSRCGTDN